MPGPSKIRVLIAEDEPLAREGLRLRLARMSDIEIVAEAGSGPAAVEAIRTHRPDLVFLDVMMPGMDGFAVIEQLADAARPLFVFVTAFDQFATRGFDVDAIDYFVKPYTTERLALAVDRARRELERGGRASSDGYLRRFVIRDRSRCRLVPADDVRWISAAANYAELHTRTATHLVRRTLSSLERELDPSRFVRIHRTAIVNVRMIERLERETSGDYRVRLQDGAELRLSRTHRSSFFAVMG